MSRAHPLDECGTRKKQLTGITHIQREINDKKDIEVEDLKNETFETVGSLGASRVGAQFGDCWGKEPKFLS